MPFLTIFTAPKPFTHPHIDTIQRNAIRSWQQLDDVEVLIIGDEDGMAAVAAEYGVTHLPEVACNEWGTPLVSSIFSLAREHSRSPYLCFVNADILLMPDVLEAARRVRDQATDFLILGKRWDLDIVEPLDFSSGWVQTLRDRTTTEGNLHPPMGSDYFVFPKPLFTEMPDFAIGRPGWDNWMIFHARKKGWPAIDATPDVMIVHQNHDYAHLGGVPPYGLAEAKVNFKLARSQEDDYTGYIILDTDKELRRGKISAPKPSLIRTLRRLELAVAPKEKHGPRWAITRWLRQLWRRLTQ
jgi:hypothetical protein